MEYIIIALCVLLFILMIAFVVVSKRKDDIRASLLKKLISSNSDYTRSRQELETALVRIKNLNSDVVAYQEISEELKTELRKRKASDRGNISSDDLNARLRFVLPDGELVNTVKVKLEREEEEIVGVQATVRKKISGKFTDVIVTPILLPSLN